MSKYTRLNKINHYYDSSERSQTGPSDLRFPQGYQCCSDTNNTSTKKVRDYPKTILATKSLTNLITIKPRPLMAAERRRRDVPSPAAQKDNLQYNRHRLYLFSGGLTGGRQPATQQLQGGRARRLKRARASELKPRTINQVSAPVVAAKLDESPKDTKQIMTIISPGVKTRSGKLMMVEHSRVRSYKLAFLTLVTMSMLMMMLVCCLSGQVDALRCYNCTSSDDSDCDESFSLRSKFNITDCKELVPQGQEGKVCRKIVQHMHDTKVVIRSCGYIDEHHNQQPDKDRKDICYKRSGTFAVTMESCNCYQEGCNHSNTLVPITSTNLGLLFMGLILTLLWSNNMITL